MAAGFTSAVGLAVPWMGRVSKGALPDAICFDASAAPALGFDGDAAPAIKYDATADPAIDFDGQVGCD